MIMLNSLAVRMMRKIHRNGPTISDSRIEWTQSTWNPVIGCIRISAECANCYAE